MELQDVITARRMVRNFSDTPIPQSVRDRLIRNALRAPSAGFTQGCSFLVLEGPSETEGFWEVTRPEGHRESEWLRGMRRASLLIVVLTSKKAYLERYAQADKAWPEEDESRWSAPYWWVDAGFASLNILLTAVDEELGACFFGVPPAAAGPLRERFGIPEEHSPVGVVAVGKPQVDHLAGSRPRGRKPFEQLVHMGRW